MMKELVQYIVEKLGVAPGSYDIESAQGDGETVIQLSLPEEGLRRFDGREHRMARAIRQILSTAAAAADTRVRVEASPKL